MIIVSSLVNHECVYFVTVAAIWPLNENSAQVASGKQGYFALISTD